MWLRKIIKKTNTAHGGGISEGSEVAAGSFYGD